MQVVQRAGERSVRLERIHVQHPRFVAAFQDELRRFLRQERRLGVFHRHGRGEISRERIGVLLVVRLVALAEQEIVIGAARILVAHS